MIRVLLAEDQPIVRAGLRTLLERADDIEVVGEAANGQQAIEAARATKPDVVLMDIRMPAMDGLEATKQIIAETSTVRVIMLTTFDLDEYVFAALRAGASGFLGKDVEPDELRHAVRVVAAGEALLSPPVTRRLIGHFAESTAQDRLAGLTDREREVVTLVARGRGNDEIGRELFMSPATARTHVSRAMLKLGVRDRVQLVVLAYECGLVRPTHPA
jgi:DNA-binding NarL/FixJ family response regulator